MIFNKKYLVTIIVFVSSLCLGYLGYSQFENYKYKEALKDEKVRSMFLEISSLRQTVDELRFDNDGKIDDLKKKLSAEEEIRKSIEQERSSQQKLSQEKILILEKTLSETTSTKDFSSIIKKWNPLVVYLDCSFDTNSTATYGTTGSGVLLKLNNSPLRVLTNRHVLVGNGLYDLNFCKIKLPEVDSEIVVSGGQAEVSVSKYDWGVLDIVNPTSETNSIPFDSMTFCGQKPSLGDEIVVLGYPGIGSKNSVTATEGIISGFDGDYFITSAKVEQGNSGGAAILLKNDCFLGIPTYASLGEVESLARILDIWKVITK